MSASEIDDEFDYNSNDDGNWDQDENLDMDDTYTIFALSQKKSMEKEDYQCWKCIQCENINNVKLTIEKQNMKCCGCNNTYYLPDQTDTFQCSKWHSYHDYLWRIGVLQENQSWICNRCTFKNENIDSQHCEICQSKRSVEKDICESNNTTLSENKTDTFEWKCTNCNAITTHESECSVCGCHKSVKFDNNSPSEKLTFGYIRQFSDTIDSFDIPNPIYKLCQCFYHNYDRFKEKIGQYNIIVFPTPLKTFLCNGFYVNNIFGEQSINEEKTYVWRIKLKINNNENTNANTNQKIWGITIGICTDKIHTANGNTLVPIFTKQFFNTHLVNIFTNEFYNTYGIYGNGSYGKHKQFCRGLVENDLITVQFDGCDNTLSYGINEDWYGVAYNNIEKRIFLDKDKVPDKHNKSLFTNCTLKLAIHVEQKGIQIECVEFFEY